VPDTITHKPPPEGSGEASRLSLLVMSSLGVFTHPLPSSGEITIGRASDCDVRVEDSKVSRNHASIVVGPTLHVVDHGSANGTLLAGRRLAPNQPIPLAVGDMVTVGSTVLVLQTASAHAPLRVWSQSAFEARVAEERARARGSSTGYAVARLLFGLGTLADVSSATTSQKMDVARSELLERTLRETLRQSDVISSFSPGVYELLLTETDAEAARTVVATLERALREAGFDLEIQFECFDRQSVHRSAVPLLATVPPPVPARPAPRPGTMDEATMDRIALSAINVLILGETGVGKEVMARRLHQRSPRADAPILCLNCAALSESLLESELFGFERGAFTGATQSKPGLLESAQGGTVFLDEVGEMPPALQAKLLRVLEQREVLRVGGLKPRPIDVRFLSATNRDLETEIGAGRFRQDLYFRLNGIALRIPPLRERAAEIEPLARAFLAEACAEARRGAVPGVSSAALALLLRYAWPGNIRELRNVMERAVVLCEGDEIGLEHLPGDKMAPVLARGAPRPPQEASLEDDDTFSGQDMLEAMYAPDKNERARIIEALTRCHGNQTEAAKALGISRRALVTKIGQYDLPRPRKKRDAGPA
jgi:transcriptional regulator with AAA-type ATPase domain